MKTPSSDTSGTSAERKETDDELREKLRTADMSAFDKILSGSFVELADETPKPSAGGPPPGAMTASRKVAAKKKSGSKKKKPMHHQKLGKRKLK